jgi:aspartate aminotransferase
MLCYNKPNFQAEKIGRRFMAISDKIRKNMAAGSFIRKMFEEGMALKKIYGDDQVFDLTIGNPIMEPPQAFKQELINLANHPIPGMHRYMENAGYSETRACVAKQLALDTGIGFTRNEIVMTIGTAGALNSVFKALLNPGEEIITFAPYFFEYATFADNHCGSIKVLPSDETFTPDFKALEAAISKNTKAIIINSPNNPTGIVYSEGVLKELAETVARASARLNQRIYIVSDDVYSKLYFGRSKCPRIIHHYPHSIVVTSFSKDLSLPGERIGYVAVHPECEKAREVVDAVIYANRVLGYVNAPALMQLAIRSLQNVSVSILEYQRKRDLLYNNLTRIGYQITKPQGAFYIFPKSPIEDDLAFVNELKKLKVLVVPGTAFAAPGYFRISYCLDDKTLEGSLSGFQQIIEQVRR